jgi:hypothetical protein
MLDGLYSFPSVGIAKTILGFEPGSSEKNEGLILKPWL